MIPDVRDTVTSENKSTTSCIVMVSCHCAQKEPFFLLILYVNVTM